MFHKFSTLVIGVALGAGLASGPTSATPVQEAPWIPEAAAYRLTLFLGNLTPVPWDELERA